jgi:hypothetical protein
MNHFLGRQLRRAQEHVFVQWRQGRRSGKTVSKRRLNLRRPQIVRNHRAQYPRAGCRSLASRMGRALDDRPQVQ